MIYRTAFKLGDEWFVMGPPYVTREDAVRRATVARQHNPAREVIVVVLPDVATPQDANQLTN